MSADAAYHGKACYDDSSQDYRDCAYLHVILEIEWNGYRRYIHTRARYDVQKYSYGKVSRLDTTRNIAGAATWRYY